MLLGRNGVGKTTLLKCLMGALPVSSGQVIFDGSDISRYATYLRVRRGFGYVPQGRDIFPNLTVGENLTISIFANDREGNAGFSLDTVLERFSVLRTMWKRRGGDLSGGQQQQLAIGRALLTNPRLLILDEPTEGIQPSIIKEIKDVILSLKGLITILLVEQYYDFAYAVADDYVVMSRGAIVAKGAKAEMNQNNIRGFISI